jgi:signal transduction histidine kinase/ActR/RegA family two-component response regulator
VNQAEPRANHHGLELLKDARYVVVTLNRYGLVERVQCPGIDWRIEGLQTGRELPGTLQAVVSASHGTTTPQLYPYVQLDDGLHADVHVLNGEARKQIIVQDVSEGYAGEHNYQQKAHEVSLLLEKQAELSQLLEARRAEAEEASRTKSRFIASMSHEFKSPITSIMAYAESLRAEQADAREPAAIQRASWYLLTLVENLLEQARMEDTQRSLDPSSVDIHELLDDMRELFLVRARSRGLEFKVAHSDEALRVRADELRLRQVLVNLLSNAIRFTREGAIGLSCRRRGDVIEFRVEDSGRGIGKEHLDRVFQPFTQVDPEGEGGAGLGLTISKHLVAKMHGVLEVESEVGKGSVFSFSLPVPPEEDRRATGELRGLNVLLVEDDVDMREMYCIWLEDWGMQVRAVGRMDQAIAEFRRTPADLVVTDLFLEDGDGVALLDTLREIQADVASVLCSGSDSIAAFCGVEGSVIDSFVPKPVSADRLEAALRAVIQRGKQE